MVTSISDFDYALPERLIAQHSVEPRDQSRLMVLRRDDQIIEHRSFFELGDAGARRASPLRPGDVLVMNRSRVFKARLRGRKVGGTIDTEVTLLRPQSNSPSSPLEKGGDAVWEAMVYPGRRLKVGDRIALGNQFATVEKKTDTGVTLLSFDCSDDDVFALCDAIGEIPVPPYVERAPDLLSDYQTVYAQETGSVAAPTAGFHFTDRLLDELREKGVQIEFVTLHVGLGTFQPFKGETLEEHKMHSEFVQIDTQTAGRINDAKKEGRRVIAVGTTTVRALEGSIQCSHPERGVTESKDLHEDLSTRPSGSLKVELPAWSGDVDLFITPGFEFQIVDGLITNFHLPKTTLLVLVSSFAGRDFVMRAYKEAVDNQYRFFSFGDAMMII